MPLKCAACTITSKTVASTVRHRVPIKTLIPDPLLSGGSTASLNRGMQELNMDELVGGVGLVIVSVGVALDLEPENI